MMEKVLMGTFAVIMFTVLAVVSWEFWLEPMIRGCFC